MRAIALHIGSVHIGLPGLVLLAASIAGVVYAVSVLETAEGRRDWAVVMLLTAGWFPWQVILEVLFASVRWGTLVGRVASTWGALVLSWLPLIAVFGLAVRRQRGEAG